MKALTALESRGLALSLRGDDLYIEPAELVTDDLAAWIRARKPAICRELLERHIERWHWFVSLAEEHGIEPEVVAESFPTRQDRPDVVEPPEHTDAVLVACMATLCSGVEAQQRQAEHERQEERRRTFVCNPDPATVKTCGRCQHFRRLEHLRLGNCMAGEPQAVCGLWDSDPRNHCRVFRSRWPI